AEDGIRDGHVTGVQTCALPISDGLSLEAQSEPVRRLMSEEWFQNTRPSRLPRLTDFLTPRDTYQVMPAAPDLRGSDYDDKFRIRSEERRVGKECRSWCSEYRE